MDIRSLSYDDRFTQYLMSQISSDTTGDSIDNEMVLSPDVVYPLVLNITGDEYTKMFSALMTGADLKFTDETHQLQWLLWKAAKMGTFCEHMLLCIENNTDVQDAIIALIGGSDDNDGEGHWEYKSDETITAANWLPEWYVCDDDHMWAMALGLTDAIHTATEEFFGDVDNNRDPISSVGVFTSSIPIVSIILKTASSENWIAQVAKPAYDLAWSEAVRQELTKELFCLMKLRGDCTLDFDMIMQQYLNIDGVILPIDSANYKVWISWLFGLAGTFAVDTVKIGSLFGLLALRFGGKWHDFVYGIGSFKNVVYQLRDDVNSGHIGQYCGDEWEHTWNFATHNSVLAVGGDFYVDPLRGYIAPNGVFGVGQDLLDREVSGVVMQKNEISEDTYLVRWYYEYTAGSNTDPLEHVGSIHAFPNDQVLWYIPQTNGQTTKNNELTQPPTASCQLSAFSSSGGQFPKGSIVVKGISLYGNSIGGDPYAGQDTGAPPW